LPEPAAPGLFVPTAYVHVAGSHAGAVALLQLLLWEDNPGSVKVVVKGAKRWLVPEEDDWEQACVLGGTELEGALAKLRGRGLVERKRLALALEGDEGEPEKPVHVRVQRDVLETGLADPDMVVDPERSHRELTSAEVEAREAAAPLCELLAARVERNGGRRPLVSEAWRSEMEKLVRLDGRPASEVEEMIRWATRHEFWRQNILSPKKLRGHFARLVIQRSSEGDERLVPDIAELSDPSAVSAEQQERVDSARRLCALLAEHAAKASGSTVTPNDAWVVEMMKLLEERTADQVTKAIIWLGTDDFWRSKVLSPKTLRDKYVQLQAAAKASQRRYGVSSRAASEGMTDEEKFQALTAGFEGRVIRIGGDQ
jgi:hypothetical protein